MDERTGGEPDAERLRDEAESFATLFNATQEGMVLVERGLMIAANRTVATLLGRRPEDLIGRAPSEFAAPGSRELIDAQIGDDREGAYEAELLRADGAIVPVQVLGRNIRHRGRVVRLSTIQDIGARRATEVALRASEQRFRALVQHSSDVTIIRDLDGTIRYMSPAAERVFGYPPEALVGRNRAELLHPEDMQGIAGSVARIHAESGVHRPIVYRVQHRDGSWRYLEGTATNLLDEPTIAGIVVNARDITERVLAERERDATLQREQQARAEAEAALRARDDFLTVAAHELKTPLAVMKGNADLLARALRREEPDPERLHRLNERIRSQVGRLEYLVNDLLALSRLRQGELPLRPLPFDFAALAAQVVERFGGTVAEGGRHTLTLAAPAPIVGIADEDRVEQVLTNLVGNAIKYSPEGGAVDIAVAREGEMVVLSVRDRGIGIPAGEQAAIFEPFARTAAASAVAGGIGIGLYITAQIVAAHGGALAVASAPGCGSTFTVRLPLAGPGG